GADRWISNHTDGVCTTRCGSFASSGLPLSVLEPATTQLFEPCPGRRAGAAFSRSSPETPPCRLPAITGPGSVGRSGNRSSTASQPRRSAISARSSSLSQLADRPQPTNTTAAAHEPSSSGTSGSSPSTEYSTGG